VDVVNEFFFFFFSSREIDQATQEATPATKLLRAPVIMAYGDHTPVAKTPSHLCHSREEL
jgi:hypothetical protein